MSDEQNNSNVLNGSDTSKVLDGSWVSAHFKTNRLEFGTPYALSVTYDSSADGLWLQARFNYWNTDWKANSLSVTPSVKCAKGKHVATLVIPSFDKPDDFKSATFMVQASDISGKGTIEISRPMLVEGDQPAAWAPAEGETLAGGGALMSANLWDAKNVISDEIKEDGIYACSGARGVRTNVALDRLAENQTFHCGFSVNPGANDAFNVTLCYRDAAGSVNYAAIPDASVTADKWTRVSGSVVVPSGMTVYQMVICNNGNASGASGWKVTNPTLSLGSPVVLASSAHTPYATQDHVTAELNGMRDTVAPTEDTGAASRNYAVGEFFYDASHNLCRVTQAVSQGASLVSGTNYTTVSGGVQQYIGTPTYVYETAPSEATVKAAHATPCFVYAVDTASFYYVS